MIKTVVIIDDDNIIRAGVRAMIQQESGIQIVGEGWVGAHLDILMEKHQPDIVFLDINMPQYENEPKSDRMAEGFQALPAITRLHTIYPKTAIIILSQYISLTLIEGAFEVGVKGYVLKDDVSAQTLPQAIKDVRSGKPFLSNAIQAEMIRSRRNVRKSPLTSRQREVILELASDYEISDSVHAQNLGITETAFRNHLTNIFKVMGVTSRLSCIVKCMSLGIIPFETKYIQ